MPDLRVWPLSCLSTSRGIPSSSPQANARGIPNLSRTLLQKSSASHSSYSPSGYSSRLVTRAASRRTLAGMHGRVVSSSVKRLGNPFWRPSRGRLVVGQAHAEPEPRIGDLADFLPIPVHGPSLSFLNPPAEAGVFR